MGRRGLRVKRKHDVTGVGQRPIADSCDVGTCPDLRRQIGADPPAESGRAYASDSPGFPDGDASLSRAAYWDQRDWLARLRAIERGELLSAAGSSVHPPILVGYSLRRQYRPRQPISSRASGAETA